MVGIRDGDGVEGKKRFVIPQLVGCGMPGTNVDGDADVEEEKVVCESITMLRFMFISMLCAL